METQKVDSALCEKFRTCDPDIPKVTGESGRFMMTKVGRNCMKKQITRYFGIEKMEMVQYGREDSQKPNKRISMKDAKIMIESQDEESKNSSAVPKPKQDISKHV